VQQAAVKLQTMIRTQGSDYGKAAINHAISHSEKRMRENVALA